MVETKDGRKFEADKDKAVIISTTTEILTRRELEVNIKAKKKFAEEMAKELKGLNELISNLENLLAKLPEAKK